MLILLYAIWNVQQLLSKIYAGRQHSSNKIVSLQALIMKCEHLTRVLIYITTIIWLADLIRQFNCLFDILVPHTNFNKQQQTFQGGPGNSRLTL